MACWLSKSLNTWKRNIWGPGCFCMVGVPGKGMLLTSCDYVCCTEVQSWASAFITYSFFFFFQIWGLKFFLQSLVFLCLSNLWPRCLKLLIQVQDSGEYLVHEPEGKASGQAKERRDGTWFRLTCMLGSSVFWKCIKFFPKRKFPF